MSMTLILVRHGKSDWSGGEADMDRPLNDRGRRAAAAIGDWLARRGAVPDAALVSPARRTVETWERIAARLETGVAADFDPRLYLAAPAGMLEVMRGGSGETVLMIGHNPGIGGFAAGLLRNRPEHGRFGDYPTGATLIARFHATSWRATTPGAAEPVAFVVPRDLS